eukprot:EG_transcript_8940
MAKRKPQRPFRRAPPPAMRGAWHAVRQSRSAGPRWGRRGRPHRFSPQRGADYIPLMVVQPGWRRPKRPVRRDRRFSERSIRIAEQDFADFGAAAPYRVPRPRGRPQRGLPNPQRGGKAARVQRHQRERRLQTSLQHFLREDSDAEQPVTAPLRPRRPRRPEARDGQGKGKGKGRGLQAMIEAKRKSREEKDHMLCTHSDVQHTSAPTKVGRCHFGQACPDIDNGCPFLHDRQPSGRGFAGRDGRSPAVSFRGLHPTKRRAGPATRLSSPPPPEPRHQKRPTSLKPAQLKAYARALARLEKSAGRPLYDPKTGVFDEAALADPRLGFATIAPPKSHSVLAPAEPPELLLQAPSAEAITAALLRGGVVPADVEPLGGRLYRVGLRDEAARREVLRRHREGRQLLGTDIAVVSEGAEEGRPSLSHIPGESDTSSGSDAEGVVVSDADSQAEGCGPRPGGGGGSGGLGGPQRTAPPPAALATEPAWLSPGWEQRWDDILGRPYYVNHSTKTLRWDLAAVLTVG